MPPQVFKETKVTKNGVETKTSYPVQWAFVQIQQLLLLFTYCLECGKELRTKHYRFIGSALIIDYICATGHSNTWSSSQFHHQVPLNKCKNSMCGYAMWNSVFPYAALFGAHGTAYYVYDDI